MAKQNYKKIDFRYNLGVYLNFLKKYKNIALFVVFLSILVEMRSLVDKYLFKVIIDHGTEFLKGIIIFSDFLSTIVIISFVFAFILSASVVMLWFKENYVIRLESNMIRDLKQKYLNHLVGLHHDFHITHKTGSLISRLLRGGSNIERMTDTIVYEFLPLLINIIAVTFFLIYFDWTSAIIVFLVSVSFITYGVFIQKVQEDANLRANQAEDFEKANVSDFLTNIDSIKYYGKEKLIKNKYEKISTISMNAQAKHWNYFRWYGSVLVLIFGIGTFLIVYFSLKRFFNNEISLGTLVFIYTAYLGLSGPMWMFNNGIRSFYRAMADFQDLFQYGKIENQVKDKPGAKELFIREGEIEFKEVHFKYGNRKIFENFNLKIPKNKKIAVVGHSGCGKTTLIKLLYRFYDVDSGQILIDGKDITKVKQESLRNEMSIVPQECVLFDDTIYNNIKFSKPRASRKEILDAIKFAQLDKVIKEFPKKENTVVGERGVRLSGGEKQRVSIARAILGNKKILVLDEATSSLDSETESEIQKDLDNLMTGRTSIIIAHRLSTIMKADLIVVMKKGKIAQIGKHEELIKESGEYSRLWNLQRGGYIK